jgi:hypothetical protein
MRRERDTFRAMGSIRPPGAIDATHGSPSWAARSRLRGIGEQLQEVAAHSDPLLCSGSLPNVELGEHPYMIERLIQ